jgi:hypothetical protein
MAGADESPGFGPEVPGVRCATLLSCSAERLARARESPAREVVRDASEPQSVGPPPDPSEEMHLVILPQVFWPDITDASFINFSI